MPPASHACRCGQLMQETPALERYCGHCDRSPDCKGLDGGCPRCITFERAFKTHAVNTAP